MLSHSIFLQAIPAYGRLLALLLCLCLVVPSYAQKGKSKEQLEREKKENLRKIKETAKILEQTKAQKEASVGQLNAIQEKISVQKEVISNISKELSYLESDVQETESIVQAMQDDLQDLKDEYAAMIYAASKTSSQANKLMFLFAAESFNQFMRRLHYLRQYSEARKMQVEQIQKVQEALNAQLADLTNKKIQKKNLLSTQLVENRNLLNLKKEQNQMVSQLSQKEQKLQRDLKEKQNAVKKLETLIADIVREEIRKAQLAARREAEKRAAAGKPAEAPKKGSPSIALTPEAKMISSNFAGNKSRLIWPVERGFISQRFGTHAHPVLKGVVIENLGVDIQTNSNEPVRAVFDGTVATIAYIQGMGNVVMVQHGEYFSVYGNMKTTTVKTGQKVKAKDTLGTVSTDTDNTSVLKFFIWKGNTKLNPEQWLYNK